MTGETAYRPVVELIRNQDRPIWEVTVELGDGSNEVIATTEEHPWRTTDGRWVETDDLQLGFKLVTAEGLPVEVVSIAASERVADTYNIEVEEFHTYFVGETGVWVHNVCRDLANLARSLGYRLDRSFGRPHGQEVFRSGRYAISRDIDSHIGGYWKMFRIGPNGRLQRTGTYNRELTERLGP